MKKILASAIGVLLSSVTHGALFIVVECKGIPGLDASVSEPVTGKMTWTKNCGEALAHVPSNYFFLSAVTAGEVGSKYLFSDTPANR